MRYPAPQDPETFGFERITEAHDRLRNIGKPTIARLNGLTVGGGNEFNLACDLAVAAIREELATGGSTEFQWGPYTRTCPACGASPSPEAFAFCGRYGHRLEGDA
jgi:enoyl-CoA hydratase/carnithine racemase